MNRPRGIALLLTAVVIGGGLTGCVRRTLTIKTEPEGALVFLNDHEIGRTPVDIDFLWYGDYDVIIRKDGYETLQTSAMIVEPWYQIPVVDLFTESFWPGTFHDEQTLSYTLEPRVLPDRADVLDRAEDLRARALFDTD